MSVRYNTNVHNPLPFSICKNIPKHEALRRTCLLLNMALCPPRLLTPPPPPFRPRERQVEIIWLSEIGTGIAKIYQLNVYQRPCIDGNSPYKRKCWTNSVGPLISVITLRLCPGAAWVGRKRRCWAWLSGEHWPPSWPPTWPSYRRKSGRCPASPAHPASGSATDMVGNIQLGKHLRPNL